MKFSEALGECSDFECIFKLVKQAVETTTGRRRVGLILGLMDLPMHIGAFHGVGTNFIVMNKRLLEEVLRVADDKKLVNSYVFHILLHEYMHSLGFLDERETQTLTYAISAKVLGKNHPATLISKYGITSIFPRIGSLSHLDELERIDGIEIIREFENDNLNYIG
jgi:hypothetical protein